MDMRTDPGDTITAESAAVPPLASRAARAGRP